MAGGKNTQGDGSVKTPNTTLAENAAVAAILPRLLTAPFSRHVRIGGP